MSDFANYVVNEIKKLLEQKSELSYLQESNAWMKDVAANALSEILGENIFGNSTKFDRDVRLKFELNKYLKNITESDKKIIYE